MLGCLAAGAIAQAAGCSSDDSQAPADAGSGADRTVPQIDAGSSTCSGALPVMTARDTNGNQVAPDWSCYGTGAGFLLPIVPLDDGGDAAAGDDAGDATGDDAASDASTDAGEDAAPSDAGDAGPADAGPTADGGGDAGSVNYTMNVIEFLTHQGVAGVNVDLFFGRSAQGTPAFTGTTNATGDLSFTGPPTPGEITYHATGTNLLPLYYFDLPLVSPPDKIIGYTILLANAQSLVTSVLGNIPPLANGAVITAGVRDCANREIRGGVIDLIDDATGQPVQASSDPNGVKLTYFSDTGLPDPRCTYTANGSQALWTAINAPTNMPGATHSYSLRFSGRMKDSDPVGGAPIYSVKLELYPGAGHVPRPYKVTPPK